MSYYKRKLTEFPINKSEKKNVVVPFGTVKNNVLMHLSF